MTFESYRPVLVFWMLAVAVGCGFFVGVGGIGVSVGGTGVSVRGMGLGMGVGV